MYDRELVIEMLRNVVWSLEQIAKRFQSIRSSEDFIKDDAGREKLDSICMQLITIGEAFLSLMRRGYSLLIAHCSSLIACCCSTHRSLLIALFMKLQAQV